MPQLGSLRGETFQRFWARLNHRRFISLDCYYQLVLQAMTTVLRRKAVHVHPLVVASQTAICSNISINRVVYSPGMHSFRNNNLKYTFVNNNNTNLK